MLALLGEQGTGKSSATKNLVQLVDPSPVPLRKPPRDADGWVTAASGSWVVGLDNLSTIPPWLSDSLCRAVTGDGDGDVRRELYSGDGLSVFSFRRVIPEMARIQPPQHPQHPSSQVTALRGAGVQPPAYPRTPADSDALTCTNAGAGVAGRKYGPSQVAACDDCGEPPHRPRLHHPMPPQPQRHYPGGHELCRVSQCPWARTGTSIAPPT